MKMANRLEASWIRHFLRPSFLVLRAVWTPRQVKRLTDIFS
jgi:hypothetical protein